MNFFEKIKEIVEQFQSSMKTYLPQLQVEVSNIITRKEKDIKTIEYLLDTLLSLQTAGIGRELFIELLNYYKTIDADNAAFYWNAYEEMDE